MKNSTPTKEVFKKAFCLFNQGLSKQEIKERLNLSENKLNKWAISFNKWKRHEQQEKFKRDYSTGKYNIEQLAELYGLHRNTVLRWKYKYFGKENIRQKRMYQMKLAEIPTHAIADYFKISIIGVSLSIRRYKIDNKIA